MADLIPFYCEKTKRRGFTIAKLPMPDGTRRAYKEYGGKTAIKTILEHWQADCAEMKRTIQNGQTPGPRCHVINFNNAANA